MTLQAVAFAMPFVTLAFMAALTFGVVRYNRRPADDASGVGKYVVEVSSISWDFQKPSTTSRQHHA